MEDKTIKKFYKCHSQLSSVYGYISAILKDRDITDEERKDLREIAYEVTQKEIEFCGIMTKAFNRRNIEMEYE